MSKCEISDFTSQQYKFHETGVFRNTREVDFGMRSLSNSRYWEISIRSTVIMQLFYHADLNINRNSIFTWKSSKNQTFAIDSQNIAVMVVDMYVDGINKTF